MVYNWEKKNKENGWRDSNFHLIWTIAKGDEGVAVHLTATVKSSSELEFGGYAYVFGKNEDKWKATHKLGLREATDNRKTLSSGDWKNRFPKMGEHFTRKGMSSDYWEFLEDGGTRVRESGSHNNMWWKWRNTTNPNYNMKY